MKILRVGQFEKMLKKLFDEDVELFDLAQIQIKLFQKNYKDTRLKTHALKKKMEGKWAFSVDNDVRVVFEWLGKTTVRFLAIGDHNKVYRGK